MSYQVLELTQIVDAIAARDNLPAEVRAEALSRIAAAMQGKAA